MDVLHTSSRRFLSILVVLAGLLSIAPVSAQDESYNGLTLGDCYTIRFVGYELDHWGNSTWKWVVDQDKSCKDLSNWVIELPGCYYTDIIGAYPTPWEFVENETHTGLNGIKWEPDWDYEERPFPKVFQLRIAGKADIGWTQVGVKAGQDVYVSEPTHKVRAPHCRR